MPTNLPAIGNESVFSKSVRENLQIISATGKKCIWLLPRTEMLSFFPHFPPNILHQPNKAASRTFLDPNLGSTVCEWLGRRLAANEPFVFRFSSMIRQITLPPAFTIVHDVP